MKVEARSSLITLIALITGFVLGMFYQQRSDEHKWFMTEFKKNKSIQNILDTKISDAVTDYKKGVKR